MKKYGTNLTRYRKLVTETIQERLKAGWNPGTWLEPGTLIPWNWLENALKGHSKPFSSQPKT